MNFEEILENLSEAGVYGIFLKKKDTPSNEACVYIGQSSQPMIRLATHMTKWKNDPNYFGISMEKALKYGNIRLKMLFTSDNEAQRRKEEVHYIKKHQPITQSRSRDIMKSNNEKEQAFKLKLI